MARDWFDAVGTGETRSVTLEVKTMTASAEEQRRAEPRCRPSVVSSPARQGRHNLANKCQEAVSRRAVCPCQTDYSENSRPLRSCEALPPSVVEGMDPPLAMFPRHPCPPLVVFPPIHVRRYFRALASRNYKYWPADGGQGVPLRRSSQRFAPPCRIMQVRSAAMRRGSALPPAECITPLPIPREDTWTVRFGELCLAACVSCVRLLLRTHAHHREAVPWTAPDRRCAVVGRGRGGEGASGRRWLRAS